jgi:uncharacterized protein with GYD domain
MFGKYTADGMDGISAERTEEARALVKKLGGEMVAGYALLGAVDLVFIVKFPRKEEAMQASVALSKLTGIGFTTAPAVAVEDFDRLMGQI